MQKLYKLLILSLFLIGFTIQTQAQDCQKTCEIQKEVGNGVFLGVQIHSHKDKSGVHVVNVVEGTQAEKMGIQKGDFIQSINKVEMNDTPFMVKWVGEQKAGMPVTIALTRKGENMTINGELGFKTVETVTERICCDENVGKLEVANFATYPNPNRGNFMLSFDTKNDAAIDMKIIDFSGNLIFENTINPSGGRVNEQIRMLSNVSGDHIMILTQDGKTIEKKIVFIK